MHGYRLFGGMCSRPESGTSVLALVMFTDCGDRNLRFYCIRFCFRRKAGCVAHSLLWETRVVSDPGIVPCGGGGIMDQMLVGMLIK